VIFSTLVSPAAIFFPLVFGLYVKRTNRRIGFAAILVAAIAGVADQAWLAGHAPLIGAIDPLFFGPLAGLIVLAGGTLAAPQHTIPIERPIVHAHDL